MRALKKPKDDQVGLKKLPEEVRNKMGFMKDGGTIEYKKGGKLKKKKKGKGKGYASLSAAQKQVYKRGLAAYMSSGNRPKVSQHAWAMARVKSAFGKAEAKRIARKKKRKDKKAKK